MKGRITSKLVIASLATCACCCSAELSLTNSVAYARQRVLLEFDGPLSNADFDPDQISFSPEVHIRSRSFRPEGSRVWLETTPLDIDVPYTLRMPGRPTQGAFVYRADRLDFGLVSHLAIAAIDQETIADAAVTDTPFSLGGPVTVPQPGVYQFNGLGTLHKPLPRRFDEGYSISLWVKADTLIQAASTGIFHNYTATSPNGQRGFQIEFGDGDDPQFQWRCQAVEIPLGPVRTTWVHLAITATANKVQFFYNGAWYDSEAMQTNGKTFNELVLGVNRGGKRFFKGQVADLRVYEYPLYPGQIERIFTETRPKDGE